MPYTPAISPACSLKARFRATMKITIETETGSFRRIVLPAQGTMMSLRFFCADKILRCCAAFAGFRGRLKPVASIRTRNCRQQRHQPLDILSNVKIEVADTDAARLHPVHVH